MNEANLIKSQGVGYVDSCEKLEKLLTLCKGSQEKFEKYTQEQVDELFKRCSIAATQYRLHLAKIAVEEAGMGIVEDKTIKNHFAAETVYNAYKNMKTCGVVEEDQVNGYSLYAEPVGILAGIVPCTNPTSTTIFKALIALKTRNCIVFSPHPRTVKCTIEAAKIIRNAAIEAGAPENCIGWIDKASIELCNALMKHPKVSMIVATGAGGLIKTAYSSGKPCMGGGAGNTPVIIDETADIPMSVNSVIISKTFDNGMICASEQAIIAVEAVADKVKQEFVKRGGYFLKTDSDKEKIANIIFKEDGSLKPEGVGQSASKLLEMAKIENLPKDATIVLAEIEDVGPHVTLSREKLCPCLGFFKTHDYDSALALALRLIRFGGMGHTSVLYTDLQSACCRQRIQKFQDLMPTGRTLICMPTSQGAIGGLYNSKQSPSLSLGCGTWGGNSSAEGLQPKHLLNYKQVAERRNAPEAFFVPNKVYIGGSAMEKTLEMFRISGVLQKGQATKEVVSHVGIILEKKSLDENFTTENNIASKLESFFNDSGINVSLLYNSFTNDAYPSYIDPCAVVRVAKEVVSKKIDALIAIGGAVVTDGITLVRMVVEHPEVNWEFLTTKFMRLTQRIYSLPKRNHAVKMVVVIPTQNFVNVMTPYVVIIDHLSNTSKDICNVLTVADISLLPDVVTIDYSVAENTETKKAIEDGCTVICNAMESLVSLIATNKTREKSEEGFKIFMKHFLASLKKENSLAKQECCRGSNLVGMATGNGLLGISESLTHQLKKHFNIPDGLGKFMLICQVIIFNSSEAPKKMGAYPQYDRPKAREQYIQLARGAGICPKEEISDKDCIMHLINKLTCIKKELGIPLCLKDFNVNEEKFLELVDSMAFDAFDDQFTGTNPRYPLVTELVDILLDAYYGRLGTLC